MTSSGSQSSDSCPTSRGSDLNDGVLPQRKRRKYHSSYQSSWESDERFRSCVRKSKKEVTTRFVLSVLRTKIFQAEAFCTFCAKDINMFLSMLGSCLKLCFLIQKFQESLLQAVQKQPR